MQGKERKQVVSYFWWHEMSIALRRHHRARLKRNRRFHWGRDLRGDEKALSVAAETPCPCSCPMCGNPRKYFGHRTMQEARADLNESDEAKGVIVRCDDWEPWDIRIGEHYFLVA